MTSDDIRDQLPDDLNAVDFVGAYKFPDNSRRRIPGYLYLLLAVDLRVRLSDRKRRFAIGK